MEKLLLFSCTLIQTPTVCLCWGFPHFFSRSLSSVQVMVSVFSVFSPALSDQYVQQLGLRLWLGVGVCLILFSLVIFRLLLCHVWLFLFVSNSKFHRPVHILWSSLTILVGRCAEMHPWNYKSTFSCGGWGLLVHLKRSSLDELWGCVRIHSLLPG